ncbi:MAG: aspartate carbamoyltransferase regulatory subunit [Rikenellaceae bacterium]
METKKSVLEVSAIENGTVIDHIPSQNLFDVMNILQLDKMSNRITFGTNLDSVRIGKKAIIKIADVHIGEDQINKIIAFAPQARVSYIKDFKVERKVKVQVPDTIEGNIKCANPMCITNLQNVTTRFTVIDKEALSIECHYCERTTLKSQFKLKL